MMTNLWVIPICLMTCTVWAGEREGLQNYCLGPENLALQGYSPVSYFQRNKAELGNKNFAVTHNGITYHFTDADQMAMFKADPEKYEPAHGGWCSVMMGSSGSRAMANPEAFKIVDGRLMVFYRGNINGADVDGLQIWNSRKSERAVLRKADKQWRQLLSGSRESQIVDVGDSAVPKSLRKAKPSVDAAALLPGDSRIDGSRIRAFSATYKSPMGTMTLSMDPSSDITGEPTHNVITELRYPNAVIVENYILKQKSMESRYCFRPMVGGPDSHYLAGFFDGANVRGSRTYFGPKDPEPLKAQFESPVFEAQLNGYVLAAMTLEAGFKGKLPCYDPISLKPYWRAFEVKPRQTLTLGDAGSRNAWPVVFDEGSQTQTTLWISDQPPYLLKRERLMGGNKVVQELISQHRP